MSKLFDRAGTAGCALLVLMIGTGAGHAQWTGCFTVAAGAGWVNKSFTSQSELFTVLFGATPSAAGAQMDTVMALSNNPREIRATSLDPPYWSGSIPQPKSMRGTEASARLNDSRILEETETVASNAIGNKSRSLTGDQG